MNEYLTLLGLVHEALWAAVLLGVMGGLIGVFVNARDLAFAVHGIAELTFAGGAAGLLLGFGVVQGSVLGALGAAGLIGLAGPRARLRNSLVAVLMPFGLGLGILFVSLYPGRASNKFGLLTGQVVAIGQSQLVDVAAFSAGVVLALLVMWRPLMFASIDPDVAAARGVPVRGLSIGFTLLLGAAVALSVQLIGALLVLALLVTPAAAARRITGRPVWLPALSAGFAVLSMVGGIALAVPYALPVSPFITTVSFVIYLLAWVVSRRHRQHR